MLRIQTILNRIQIRLFSLMLLRIRILLCEVQKCVIPYRYITGVGAGIDILVLTGVEFEKFREGVGVLRRYVSIS